MASRSVDVIIKDLENQVFKGLKSLVAPSEIVNKILKQEKKFKEAVKKYGSPSLKYIIFEEPNEIKENRLEKLAEKIKEPAEIVLNTYPKFVDLKDDGTRKMRKAYEHITKEIKKLNNKLGTEVEVEVEPESEISLFNWSKYKNLSEIIKNDTAPYLGGIIKLFKHALKQYKDAYKTSREIKETFQKQINEKISPDQHFKENAKIVNARLKDYWKSTDDYLSDVDSLNDYLNKLLTQRLMLPSNKKKLKKARTEIEDSAKQTRGNLSALKTSVKGNIHTGKYTEDIGLIISKMDRERNVCVEAILTPAIKTSSNPDGKLIDELNIMVEKSNKLLSQIKSYKEEAEKKMDFDSKDAKKKRSNAKKRIDQHLKDLNSEIEKIKSKHNELINQRKKIMKERSLSNKLALVIKVVATVAAIGLIIFSGASIIIKLFTIMAVITGGAAMRMDPTTGSVSMSTAVAAMAPG